MKKNDIKDFLLYLVVGGIATVTEWLIFYVFNKTVVHYIAATVIAYLLSTFVNWLFGRLLVFKKNRPSVFKEIVSVYLTSIGGLLLNLIIMWVLVDGLHFNKMISKISATAIVFFYNFFVRKLIIYRTKNES